MRKGLLPVISHIHLNHHCIVFFTSAMLVFGGFDGQVLSNIIKIQFCEFIYVVYLERVFKKSFPAQLLLWNLSLSNHRYYNIIA